MERYGENFRGGASSINCPLCDTHLDKQDMSFKCPIIKNHIDIQGNMSDVYKEDIPKDSITTILQIAKYRKTELEKQ